MRAETRTILFGAAAAAAILILATAAFLSPRFGDWPLSPGATPAKADPRGKDEHRQPAKAPDDSVELSDTQLAGVKVEAATEREFPLEKTSIGSIDFNEDMETQVFTPYQGRIIALFAKVGDEVKKGETLFTIDSPDLLQAESTLISSAGVLELTTRNVARLRDLAQTHAVSQRDLDQAISEQQTAEGALRAARDAVRIFGKTEADIDRFIAERRVDPTLIVPSPISGRITARNGAPGLFVQPGSAPAPYTVVDISTMWMLANVAESDSPAFHVGQDVKVHVMALPDHVFEGKITTVASNVDPNTRRVLVRSEVADPQHLLRSSMFATFVIQVGAPVRSVAVPLNGVVREGDGTMTVWVTPDRRRFTRRAVKIGMQHEGYDQILEGLQPGELVATEGALFLSNALATASE